MVLFNYSTKELTAKVVYYGPGLCGKTTNLQWIHEKLPIKNKGKMLSLATETDRTLFFDFLPIELGTIRGMKTRIQLYTVPGQVFYNATRRMVLKGADCVVFVCDSQEPMVEPNLESLENLRQNMEANEIDPDELPLVLQYNKRDLPNALPIEILNERLNPRGVPFYEAVAVKGIGVEETLKGVTALVFKSLATKYGGAEAGAAPRPAAPAPPPAAPPPPAPPKPAMAAPPPKPATATLPPVGMRSAAPADELLESIDLEPSPESPEPSLESDESIMEADEIEALPVEESHFDTPPPSPLNPKATLVTSEKEAADLRRRIGRPVLPDVSLEQIEEEEEEVAEISLESAPEPEPPPPPPTTPKPAPPAPRAMPPVPRPAAPSAPAPVPQPRPAVPQPRPAPSPPPPAAAPQPRPAPPPAAALPASAQHGAPAPTSAVAAPVSVQLQGATRDIAIPVEVTLQDGAAQVTIHLQVTLKLQVER